MCFWCDGTCYLNGTVVDGIFSNGTHSCDRYAPGTFPEYQWVLYVALVMDGISWIGIFFVWNTIMFGREGLNRQNVLFLLIAAQLLSDFILPMTTLGANVNMFLGEVVVRGQDTKLCNIEAFTLILSCSMSVYTSLLIAHERYRAVFYPLKKITRTRVLKMYLSLFLFLSLLILVLFEPVGGAEMQYMKTGCCIRYDGSPLLFYACAPLLVFALILTGYFYACVYKKVTRQAQQLDFSPEIVKQMKAFARSLIILHTFMVICWSPVFFTILLYGFSLVSHESAWLQALSGITIRLYSSMNPYLVIILIPQIRSGVSSTLRKTKRRMVAPLSALASSLEETTPVSSSVTEQ